MKKAKKKKAKNGWTADRLMAMVRSARRLSEELDAAAEKKPARRFVPVLIVKGQIVWSGSLGTKASVQRDVLRWNRIKESGRMYEVYELTPVKPARTPKEAP